MSKLSRPPAPPARQLEGEVRSSDPLRRLPGAVAGIDIGAHEIMVCVPGANETQIVRAFGNYTEHLYELAVWLKEHNVVSVAMESTGVYWVPLFELLESCGFECCLISAAILKRFPGQKSDVLDCQRIQTLHSYGLLAGSFRPEADLIPLRTLLRHRAQLIQHRSPHILHMQKALLHMNLQLSEVLSDVTGQTGLRIIRAIVAGERDPHTLAVLRDYRCKKEEAEIAQALTGTWRAEHLFVLAQSLALFDFYTRQIEACDQEVERTYQATRPMWEEAEPPQPTTPPDKKPHSHSKNHPYAAQTRAHLRRIAGVDLVAVDGLSVSLAQTIVAEVGTDMTRFPTEKRFCSWLGLAPHNDISGGKVLRSRTLKTHNRAGQAFRQAAAAVMRADCAFGAFYRRLKSRLGPAQAAVATAHKIARVVYRMLRDKVEYERILAQEYEQRFRENEIRYLTRKAAKLELAVTPLAGAMNAVS